VARRISEPILKLQASAAIIAAGNLEHRADLDRTDEIGALAQSFNEMSESLQNSFGQLQRALESFERFVPSKFLKTIAPRGIENIQVGESSTRCMTILFCDIRGYTTLSELLTPQETFTMINDYLQYTGRAIELCGGFIDKFIGDAIMALFDDETTDGALKAAIAMQEALKEFNTQRFRQGKPTLEIGIGIHRGEVVMGTVGFMSRMESTVIGDAVNVASRVEGLTKSYECHVLVTDAVVKALCQREWFDLELVDDAVKVKGKEVTIAIYKLFPPYKLT
jgi:class 3 adenylate cyclase